MYKNFSRIILMVILLSFLAIGNCDNPFNCDPEESIVPGETNQPSGINFDPNVQLPLPADASAVFPANVDLASSLPASLVASDSEVAVPSPGNPDQVLSFGSTFDPLNAGSFKNNMGQGIQKAINKMGGVVTKFSQDLMNRLKSEYSDMKNLEGQWSQLKQLIPYIEEDSFNVIIVKFERPGDGTYELRMGLGNYQIAGYVMNLDLFFMKWQPAADGTFKGYIIINAKLIGYVTQAIWGVKIPFEFARVDWNLQLANPSIEIWLRGLGNYPAEMPELLRFKHARLLMAKQGNGVLLKTTFEGIGNPGFMKIPSAIGINMSDCKLKFITWADLTGAGGFAAKFDDWGFRGEDPIFHNEILLEADAGIRFYFDAAAKSMGIQLEVMNPTLKIGDWETNFGDIITWILDDVLGADNWLSGAINNVVNQKLDENQFFSSAQPANPGLFWAPFIVK